METATQVEPAVDAQPFVKWAGGKRQLVPELLKYVPRNYDAYHEPFLGGGALFFALAAQRADNRLINVLFRNAFLNDVNPHLINVYKCVRDRPEELIEVSRGLAKDRSETAYYALRDAFNSRQLDPVHAAAAFIYINRGGFNGLWRVNKRGGCNVPYGGFRAGCQEGKAALVDEDNLLRASKALRDADLTSDDFDDAAFRAVPGDLVYFDPPYVPASATANFTTYTADGFDDARQQGLELAARMLVKRGVHVIASNSDTPRTRAIWRTAPEGFWELHEVQARRAINRDGAKRGKVGELIIVGRPQ